MHLHLPLRAPIFRLTRRVPIPAFVFVFLGSQAVPAADDVEAWRAKFSQYYETNAPDERKRITPAFMRSWSGRYEKLWGKVVGKYGRAF